MTIYYYQHFGYINVKIELQFGIYIILQTTKLNKNSQLPTISSYKIINHTKTTRHTTSFHQLVHSNARQFECSITRL